jgi:hypothetical protein
LEGFLTNSGEGWFEREKLHYYIYITSRPK